jgi:hypothetical protein
MNNNEMWDSGVRSAGDLAGVFEFDGDTGHFYLYKVAADGGEKVMDAIHVLSGTPDFEQGHVSVRWTPDENAVGLFIRGKLQAAFDCKTGVKYGGTSDIGGLRKIPPEISDYFKRG